MIRVVLISLLCTLGISPSQSSQCCGADSNVIAEINVASGGDALIVPILSKGVSINYLVATGSSMSLVSNDEAKGWKPSRVVTGQFHAGRQKMPIYERPESALFMGQTLRRRTEVSAMDFTRFSEVIGVELGGLLGLNDLKRFIVQVDFDQGKFRLLRSSGDEPGEKFRMSLTSGSPEIICNIRDTKVPVKIDSGSNLEITLVPEIFNRLLEEKLIDQASSANAVVGEEVTRIGRAKLCEFQLGPFKHSDVSVRSTPVSTIGTLYLSRYLVTIDFPKEVLYLKPSDKFNRPYLKDALGMPFVRRNKQVIVEGVEPRSPAEAAGIRKGDILTQVHGTDVAGQSFFKLRMQMSEVGREFKVQVIRDNKPIDVSVTLRHYD